MATLAKRIKNVLRSFKWIRNANSAVKSGIDSIKSEIAKAGGFDKIAQTIAFERFYHNQTTQNYESIDFSKNHFVLFDYPYHHILAASNLGDYIQSIATKNAVDSIYKDAHYEYFGRDYLAYYNGAFSNKIGGGESQKGESKCVNGKIAIMQGWFAHSYHFLPPKNILPVFVGTHFTGDIQRYLLYLLACFPHYFDDKTIGCRDLYTLEFCQKLGLKSYFSRCLTLTLPKATPNPNQNKIFFVGLDDKFLPFIPSEIKRHATHINQQCYVSNTLTPTHFFDTANNLLARYKNEAKLIITSALHCASPCVAMGIPVIFCRQNDEQITRFSALSGILPIYTIDDFRKKRVDFSPNAPNIEALKSAMIENLHLSVKQSRGENVDFAKLREIREFIANFKV